MKLKKYQVNNFPFVAIVDDADCPADPYATAYLSTVSGQSFNTQLRKANELLFVLGHFQKRQIDLAARVESGKFIGEREYTQFYEASCLQKNSVEGSLISLHNVTDKALRNAIAANERQMARVANETQQGRIRRLREYLQTLFEHFHDLRGLDHGMTERFNQLTSKIRLDEDSLGRNISEEPVDPSGSVIPDAVFTRLLEMILPSSPNNPFKGSRIRNYLIISILIESGIRRGALAKMKVSDCHFYGTYDQISIYRSANDPTDPRVEKPNQKTKAHLATISPILMGQIKYYVDHVRENIPRRDPHDFLFLSEKGSRGTLGQPISLKTINGMFRVLSKALRFPVHPHLLRHKWNEIFDEKGTQGGVDHRLLEDVRKYAMGWAEDTTMGMTYNSKRLAQKARELSLAHQKRVDEQ